MKIKLNYIQEPICEAFDPFDISLGYISSELILSDFRVQIKNNKAANYYVMFEGTKIVFDENGRTDTWPEGFYDQNLNLMMQLL